MYLFIIGVLLIFGLFSLTLVGGIKARTLYMSAKSSAIELGPQALEIRPSLALDLLYSAGWPLTHGFPPQSLKRWNCGHTSPCPAERHF